MRTDNYPGGISSEIQGTDGTSDHFLKFPCILEQQNIGWFFPVVLWGKPVGPSADQQVSHTSTTVTELEGHLNKKATTQG